MVSKKLIFKTIHLAFLANIALPILLILNNIYPYPAFFAEEAGAYMDFFAICHYTLNKVSNYGAFQDIYPPFGHFYCIISQFFFRHLATNLEEARFLFPDFLPFLLLILLSMLSTFSLYRSIKRAFNIRGTWFLPFCYLSSSPQLLLIDRGNLLLFSQVAINFFFALLLTPYSKRKAYIATILAAVPVASKPYMLFPFLVSPLFSIKILLFSLLENLIAYAMWAPPGISLLFRNLLQFTDSSGLSLSDKIFVGDSQAWSSALQQIRLVSKTLYTSDLNSSLVTLVTIVLYILYSLNLSMSLLAFFPFLRIYLKHRFYLISSSTFLFSSGGLLHASAPDAARRSFSVSSARFAAFIVGYTVLFSLMLALTKSIYWYSLVFLFPPLMLCDALLLKDSSRFSVLFVSSYSLVKAFMLTTLILPGFDRKCLAYPAVTRIFHELSTFLGPFLQIGVGTTEVKCYTVTAPVVLFYLSRTMLIPVLSAFAVVIIRKSLFPLVNPQSRHSPAILDSHA